LSARHTRARRHWLAAVTASALAAGVTASLGGVAAAAPTATRTPTLSARGAHADLPLPRGTERAPSQVQRDLPDHGRYAFLLRLDAASTGTAFRAARADGAARARDAARTQLSAITRAQNNVIGRLPVGSSVLYRTHALVAGVAVMSNVRNLHALAGLSGVAHVYPIAPKTASNSYAVPLQGAPTVWSGRGDLGQNTSIAIIDTGIDYTHANFGGAGTPQAYATAKATDAQANPGFPTSKVIGGFDFAGDNYDANPANPTYQPVAHPDPNPLDCGGHGSHVAGSAAGYGENANGTTYNGTYGTNTPFDTLKIGPGMAPAAKLYAFKVFGCEGSTNVVGEAIDRAMDPNGDGDTSDHVDVINMSLGSNYGFADDGDSEMSNAASDAGITVAVASGNAGDFQDVGGSPGDANKVIAVANTQDASSVIDALHVSAPVSIAGDYGAERSVAYDWAHQPDLSGNLVRLTETGNLDGCSTLNTADAAAVSGNVAFLEWTDSGTRRCGSVARAANVVAAGATGFVFADDQETFSAGITGSAVKPGVMVTKSAGDAIRAELVAGHTVTVSGTTANGFNQLFPEDNNKINASSSRGVHDTGNVKPDVAAVGTSVFSTAVGTGDQGVSFTGTSMATPMVAGLAALVRSAHPAWTPEQVKADIMNTAGQDVTVNGAGNPAGLRFAPNRVGAGRIKADAALANQVLAYDASDPGSVSASFGPLAVSSPTTLTKTIKVQNTGLSSASYNVSYDAITTVNGVSYSVSPSTVTVDPRSTKTVTLTLSIPDPDAMNNSVDPTIGRNALGFSLPRDTLADASGLVLFTPTAGSEPQLRLPVYSAPRPVSKMTQADGIALTSGQTGDTGTLALTGRDLGYSHDDGTSTQDPSDDYFSLAAAFELTARSPSTPQCSVTVTVACWNLSEEKAGDVKYTGFTSDGTMGYFAISNRAQAAIPASQLFYEVDIDTTGDGTPDYFVYNSRLGTDDVFTSQLVDTSGHVLDIELLDNRLGDLNTQAYDSNSLVLPIWMGARQWNPTSKKADGPLVFTGSRIKYGVSTWSGYSAAPLDLVGETANGTVSLSVDPDNAAVSVVDPALANAGFNPLLEDFATQYAVHRDPAVYKADGGLGMLVLHFHNGNGNKADVVHLLSKSQVALSVNPASVVRGSSTTLTVTVTDPQQIGTPSGAVTVADAATHHVVATGALNGSGTAVLTFKPHVVGSYNLVASYAGDSSYATADSAAQALTVTKAPAVVKRHVSSWRGRVHHRVKVSNRIVSVDGVKATGKVRLLVNHHRVDSAKLSAGKAKLWFTPKKKGVSKIVVKYVGDANYLKGKSKVGRFHAH
jgi:subtilisin family serine protease